MDTAAVDAPPTVASRLQRLLAGSRHALAALPRLALDIALPTVCASCR